MAIESQKIISINTGQAIQSVKELKNEISSLRDAWLQADEGTEEYEQTTEKLVEAQTKLNQVMSVGKSQVSAATGSYNALVNQMNALKRVWRETTSEVQRQALGEKIRGINDQLKELDSSIGNNQRKVGAYEQALATLNKSYDTQKAELRDLKAALDNLDPSTEAYNKAFERAAEITHNLQEQQEMLRRSASDFGTQLTNVADIGAGLVGGFNAIQGIMVLTGNESEDLTKVMAKLQAGIAVVQGLKGIDGLTKAVKGYVGWASKAYDSIKNMIAGYKNQAKQINTTTVASEANAAANNQVATSEVAAATGANTLGAGMRTAAAGTTTATAAMTAFKAVLMSLGIGLVIAAISGLITVLSKLKGASKAAYDEMARGAQNQIDIEESVTEQLEIQMQHRWELEKAQGKAEIEIAQEKYDYYKKQTQRYIDLIAEANELESNLEKWGAKRNKSKVKWDKETVEGLKVAGKSVVQLEKELEKMEANGNLVFKKMSAEAAKEFDKIKEKGIRTWGDIYNVVDWYGKAMAAEKSMYEIDPLGGLKNDIEVEKTEILNEAQEVVSGEIALENKRHNAIISGHTWTNKEIEQLTAAHNKKVWDIITGATQSIIDRAHAANQTELKNLEDTYNKELAILKKYGRDSTELTKEYAKNRAKIELQETTKNIEKSIKKLERYASSNGPMAAAYDKMEAAGVERSTQMMKLLAAKQNEIFEQNQFSLARQMNYWKDLWDKIKDDENLTLEQREAIYEKYVNAKMALEKLETQHTLDQIKTRKEALDAEIEEIEKVYRKAMAMQARTNEAENDNGKFGKNGGKMTWGGAMQYMWNGGQQSYNTMRQNENDTYSIEKNRLEEQVALYHQAATDMALSEAERTAAKQREAQARAELEEAEYEHTKRMVDLEKSEYQTLINTITSVGDSIGQIMGSIYDTIESTLEYQVKAGKISEDQMNEQLERYRWIQYAQAIINTASGALGAFTQASATIPPPYGQIVGAAAAAAVVAQGVAQIAAIRAASKNSSIDSGTKMQPVQMQPAEYQPDYTANLTGKSDTDYLRNAMDERKLFVSVTDINSVQSRVKTTEEESGF